MELQGIALITIVLVMAEIAGVLLAIDAVMRRRSSQGAIAWCIALITMPIIVIPLYLVLGRTRFLGYTEALREAEAEMGENVSNWHDQMASLAADPHDGLQAIETLTRRLTGVPFTRGNRVSLLIDAEATYGAMLEAISHAESYVLVQFYIVRDDKVGRALRDTLIEKAKSGVRVHFLYDEIGSIKLPVAYLDAMRTASIEVSGFRTTQGLRNRFQINFRNHRKLLIVDGCTGFIGGHNLGEEYLKYRDTHLRIDGPAAQQIQFTFLKDWYWATRQLIDVSTEIHVDPDHDVSVSIANTGPADRMPNCSVLFSTMVSSATHRVWITSPYFVPDDVMARALQSAALRGVDVRILLPDQADQRLVEFASFTYYEDMTKTGVKLYRYRGRFLHQKVILVDNELAGIGTVNLDNRSLYLNFEETALIADVGFAREVEAMLQADLECCDEVSGAHFDQKPLHFRAAARLARLTSPIL
ncbi:MAG: cardiolipin synthase [Planctomycetota bacterium]|nr:cardiolipin synthase [Planctomycetota bacterium]